MSISRAVNYKLSEDTFEINKYLQRIYKDRDCRSCDLNLITKNKVLRAHKLILGFTSDFFHKLLQNEQIQDIFVPDYSYESVQCLLELIYTGEVHIPYFLREEFVSLCSQFVVKIPGLHKLATAEIDHIEGPPQIPEFDDSLQEPINLKQEPTKFATKTPPAPDPYLEEDNTNDEGENACATHLFNQTLFNTDNGNLTFEDLITKAACEVLYNGKTIVDAGKIYGIPKTTLHRRVKKMKTGDVLIKRKYFPKHITRKPLSTDQLSSPHADPKIPYAERLKNACIDVIENKITYQNSSLKHGIPRSVRFSSFNLYGHTFNHKTLIFQVVFRKVKLVKDGISLNDISKAKIHLLTRSGQEESQHEAHHDLNMDDDGSENNSRLSDDSNEPMDFEENADILQLALLAIQKGMNLLAASQKFAIPPIRLHQFINRHLQSETDDERLFEPETELNESDESFLPSQIQIKPELIMNGDFEGGNVNPLINFPV